MEPSATVYANRTCTSLPLKPRHLLGAARRSISDLSWSISIIVLLAICISAFATRTREAA